MRDEERRGMRRGPKKYERREDESAWKRRREENIEDGFRQER
jgi:hypothetical protein